MVHAAPACTSDATSGGTAVLALRGNVLVVCAASTTHIIVNVKANAKATIGLFTAFSPGNWRSLPQ
jgi:hypothetical protein